MRSDHPDPAPTGRFQSTSQAVGAVIAPATVITGLLYYFGYVRTQSLFAEFGVDVAVLNMSTQDFLLRSVESLYGPLLAALLLGVAAVIAHVRVSRAVDRVGPPGLLRLGGLLLIAGSATTAGAVIAICGASAGAWALPPFVTAAAIGVGGSAWAYGRWIRLRWRERWQDQPAEPAAARTAVLVLVTLALVTSTFWLVTDYAREVGRGLATRYALEPDLRPGVVVISTRPLQLAGPGVAEYTSREQTPDSYRYRYDGLRLLVAAGNRYYLIPRDWSAGIGRSVVQIPVDAPGVRFEFSPGGRHPN